MDYTDKYISDELNKIDKKNEEEKDIRLEAAHIRELLESNPSIRYKYNEVVYEMGLRYENGKMILIRKDILKAKIAGRKYRPFIVTGEYNDLFSKEENFETLISSFLGHISGKMIIESPDGKSIM